MAFMTMNYFMQKLYEYELFHARNYLIIFMFMLIYDCLKGKLLDVF